MPSAEETKFQITAYNFCVKALPTAAIWSVDNGVENDGSERARNILMKRRRRGILSGVPDIYVLYDGITAHFELKRLKSGYLSDHQLARREAIIRNKGHWFGPITTIEQIESCMWSLGWRLSARTGSNGVPIPKPGVRRLANFAKLNEPIPDMRPRK